MIQCIMIALLICARSSSAAALPDWAIGRWVAVSSIESEAVNERGPSYTNSISKELAETQLKIMPDYIASSISLYSGPLVWGLGVKAHTQSVTLSTALDGVVYPHVFGQVLTYDLHARVTMAALSINACAENGNYFHPQIASPVYHFAKLRRNCEGYSIFRFPNEEHIAVWLKESWGANRGLVIFKRIPPDWID